MENIKVIYLNVKNNKTPEFLDIPDQLESYYKLIQCRYIDIVRRKIGQRYFNIVCDDEGMLADMAKISAISNLGEIMLVGNLIICSDKVTDDGDLTGLTEEEAEYIKERIQHLQTHRFRAGYYILTQCEY